MCITTLTLMHTNDIDITWLIYRLIVINTVWAFNLGGGGDFCHRVPYYVKHVMEIVLDIIIQTVDESNTVSLDGLQSAAEVASWTTITGTASWS